MIDVSLHWFRRDLRLTDNVGLAAALAESKCVYCAFVFDTEILEALPSRVDRRVEFIWHSLAAITEVRPVRHIHPQIRA